MREPDSRWTLRRRDWRTEKLSDPMHTSEKPLEPYGPVVDWAAKHVGQQDWTGDDHELVEPTYPYIRRVLKTATTVPVIPPNQK